MTFTTTTATTPTETATGMTAQPINPDALSVTLYTKANCPQCDATKRALDEMGADYRTIAITEDNILLLQEAGFRQAPVVMVSAGSELTDYWSGHRPEKLRGLAARQGA